MEVAGIVVNLWFDHVFDLHDGEGPWGEEEFEEVEDVGGGVECV